ncbi:MAG TPA: methyl-accepting chemotaxis protein [Candidatus Sulfotelmatobacter sp.]|nr:methyl-accepting chemotaxis protein [Candidatus Sulfotelmatobacter sp.]
MALRRRASQVFVVLLWLHVPVVAAIAAFNAHPVAPPTALAAALALIGTLGVRLSPNGLAGRLTVAWALVGMPMLFVHAGAGDLQIDFHMYFFAVFAMLVAYVDWRPIALAATLTALHHLILDFVAPLSVFPDQSGFGGLPRVLLHAVIVVVECGILIWMTVRIRALFIAADQENARANAALAESRRLRDALAGEADLKTLALTDAQRALDDAQLAAEATSREEARRLAAERTAAGTRTKIVRDVVDRIERSVRTVVEDVTRASQAMLASARDAERLAEQTRDEVAQVATITERSGLMIGEVAGATDQLSHASSEIRDRMQRALTVAQRASRESQRGGEVARSLRDATEQIDAVTTLIENVADQTRLLALNAAIEAARAGESGRGFAVVAEEVRKLAEATSSATSEIADVVGSMRRASGDVASSLEEIRGSVGDLTSAASDVAAAVDQQSAATRTIAETVRGVAEGTEVVRGAIARVREASARVGETAAAVLSGADEVVERNAELRENVGDVTRELLASHDVQLALAS